MSLLLQSTVVEVKCNALSLTSALFKCAASLLLRAFAELTLSPDRFRRLAEAAASEHSGAIREAARALAAIHHDNQAIQQMVDAIVKTEK